MKPVPVYPKLQAHVKLPGVFVHVEVPDAQLFPPPCPEHSLLSFISFFYYY